MINDGPQNYYQFVNILTKIYGENVDLNFGPIYS